MELWRCWDNGLFKRVLRLPIKQEQEGRMSIQSAIIKTWLESDISRRRGQINSVIVSQETFMALKEELYNMQRYSELSKIRGLAMVLPGNRDVCDVYFAPYFEGIAFCERVELELLDSKEGEA